MSEELIVKESKPSLPLWGRIVLAIVAFIILGGIFQFVGMLIAKVPITNMSALKEIGVKQMLIVEFFGVLSLALIVYIFRRFIDKQTIMSMGFSFKNIWKDILAGLMVALSVMGGGSIILYALNYVDFSLIQANLVSLFLSFLLCILIALNEEIFVRGYILNNLMTSMNKYLALVVSSIIFALFHGLNFDISLLAITNIFLAGIILGSTYIFTKNLWFPISLHLFWNFIQGPVLGYSVSGQKIESVFKVDLFGSTTINGGGFGFEGSIVCTILLVVAIGLIIGFYEKRTSKQQPVSAI